MLINTTLETRQTLVYNRICVYIVSSTAKLALYSIVYYRIVYYEGRVYGHDTGYEGGNLASRVA